MYLFTIKINCIFSWIFFRSKTILYDIYLNDTVINITNTCEGSYFCTMPYIFIFFSSMQVFQHKADIIPITLFVLYFICDFILYFSAPSMTVLLIYVAVSIFIKGFIGAWNHHHQHVLTFTSSFLNRMLEIMYGFQTGIIWYAWVLHHNLGHHLHYQDQSLDESAWKSPEWRTYGIFEYTWIVTITAYYRCWKVSEKYPQIRKKFIMMAIIQVILLLALIIYKPLEGILIFLIPMITGIFLGVYTTYTHHSWLESDNPYTSSYNIRSNLYNLLSGNLGYHTAHHLKWNLHWSKLPEFHKEIESKIDEKYYRIYNPLWLPKYLNIFS